MAWLIAIAILWGLGAWQLQRAAEKRALIQGWELKRHNPPYPLRLETGFPPAFTRVQAVGKFDNPHSLYIDNQFYQHQPGYQVITPLRLQDDRRLLLVDRGWIPLGADRQHLPRIPATVGTVTLTGTVFELQNKGLILGNNREAIPGWPWRIARLDKPLVEHLSHTLQQPVLPFRLVLSPKDPYGFARDETLVVTLPPERHVAYAVQWFLLALAAMIIYFYTASHRKDPSS